MFLGINWEAMWDMAIDPWVVVIALVGGACAVYWAADKLYNKRRH
jgi:hypothetical protein